MTLQDARDSPHIWEATGHRVSFKAAGKQAGWLDGRSGNWTGTFDASVYKHRYMVSIWPLDQETKDEN